HEKLRALLNSYLEEHRKRRAIEACRVAMKVGMGDLVQSSAMQMGLMTAYPPFKFDINHNLSVVLAHSNYNGCALEEQDELLLAMKVHMGDLVQN
ncbi:hypothetical protein Tco_0605539, partial [Tanacetum coccineum]